MKSFPRLQNLPPYVFSTVHSLKEQVTAQGKMVIDLGMGNPDQPTPQFIVDALVDSVRDSESHRYSVPSGIADLKHAISNWYQRRFAVTLDPENETIVTIGSKEGLAHLALAIVDSSSSVMVPSPSYPIHNHGFAIAGAHIQSLPLNLEEDFLTTLKSALKKANPKPSVLVLNFPSNPTTYCVDEAFFSEIIALAHEYKLWVVHDLAYADLAFDGYKAPSILQIPGALDVAVEAFTLSKSYNMPGWRVGFMCGNRELVTALRKMKSYLDYGLFKPIQAAAIAALNSSDEHVHEICQRYQRRRDVLCDALHKIGWNVAVPRATMFVWAQIPKAYREQGSLEFFKYLLQNAHVAVSPGIGFGEAGDSYVRFSLIAEPQILISAAEQIGRVL